MSQKPTVLDLFCGCGGLSRGFMDAGYEVLLGIDNDKPSLETFSKNHDGADTLLLDVFDEDYLSQIEQRLQKKPDIIIGGPPCQGFSLTGTRNFNDKRNTLYLRMIEVIEKFKPKAFLIENVIGLATLYNGTVKDEIIRRCSDLGYNVAFQTLCAADYGVPQMRKRVMFVGVRKDVGQFTFPDPLLEPTTYVTCSDAIEDLPSRSRGYGKEQDRYTKAAQSAYQKLMRRNAKKLYNHVATKHTPYVQSVIAQVPEGKNHKSLPPGVGESRKFNEAWTRYHSKKPSKTIDTGHRNHFHYKYNRIPTVRENARLQSFPDDFVFVGTRTQQNKQVGNAVPPLLAYHVAKQLLPIIQ